MSHLPTRVACRTVPNRPNRTYRCLPSRRSGECNEVKNAMSRYYTGV